MKPPIELFTKEELNNLESGDIVGYDNRNDERLPICITFEGKDFEFFCPENDQEYQLEELTDDFFIKA